MRARIKNFQSINDSTLELTGFTVITGPSNRGKSALIRSLAGAWFGILGDSYVRQGENTAHVVWVQGNHKIRWQKVVKKKIGIETFLEVDGRRNTKLGREHGKLTQPLGFTEVTTSYVTLRPQVAQQHDPIFLLTENETTTAEVFKLLGRGDVITTAQSLARTDTLRDTRLLNTREGDRVLEQEQLNTLNYVEQMAARLTSLEEWADDKRAEIEIKEIIRDRIVYTQALVPTKLPISPDPANLGAKISLLGRLRRAHDLRSTRLPVLPEERLGEREKKRILILKGKRLKELGREQRAMSEEIKILQEETQKTENRMEELKEELKICPTCQRSFDGN